MFANSRGFRREIDYGGNEHGRNILQAKLGFATGLKPGTRFS